MKKGFTLIELLAVIVILAIIAIIAVPTILGIVEKTKKGGSESSALGWIDAVEKQAMLNELSESNRIDLNRRYNVSELISKGVKVKGQTPSSGYVTLTNGKVSSSTLCIGNYKVVVENNKVKSSTKENNCVVDSSYPEFVYSRVNGGTHVGYPIEAGVDMGSKYVWIEGETITPFNTLEECLGDDEDPDYCIYQNFTTPDLDYKPSPDASWTAYLRITLDSNGTIEAIDVCGKHNGQEYCIERVEDDSKFEQNKTLLLNTFGSDNCDIDSSGVSCNDFIVSAYKNGFAVIGIGENSACEIFKDGAADCRGLPIPEPEPSSDEPSDDKPR